jgi:general secretion pathway protein A
LSVAGMTVAMPFDAKAMQRIHELSRGVPRRINLLCDRALLGAYASGKGQVDRAIVDKAAAEVFDKDGAGLRTRLPADTRKFWSTAALVGAGLAVAALVLSFGWPRDEPAATRVAPAAASAASGAARVAAASASAASAASAAPGDSAAQGFLTAAELSQRFKTLTRDERDAWRQLAPAWKVTLEDGEPCAVAQRSQLQCFRSASSTLALIRQLDRPGIVTLRDEADRPVYALLTGLGNDTATLRIGEVSQTIKLVSLASLWRGDFATFWRVPAGLSGKIVDAGSGARAADVARQLAALNGQPVAASDSEWKSQVSAFQLAQGLKADGIAGPTTFMQLNRATGVEEPRLRGGAATP